MRLFVFLGIAVIVVVRGQSMANFQVDDFPQSLSWRLSLSPSWDVSSGSPFDVLKPATQTLQGVGTVPCPCTGTAFLVPIIPSEPYTQFQSSCGGRLTTSSQSRMKSISQTPTRPLWWITAVHLGQNSLLTQQPAHSRFRIPTFGQMFLVEIPRHQLIGIVLTVGAGSDKQRVGLDCNTTPSSIQL